MFTARYGLTVYVKLKLILKLKTLIIFGTYVLRALSITVALRGSLVVAIRGDWL